MSDRAEELRNRIFDLVEEYHAEAFAAREFVPGKSVVPVSGRVFGADEIRSLVDASLEFWLTAGRFCDQFERELARVVGTQHALLVNSGSSANLLALSSLTSPKLDERRLRPGDEVITVAAGFPTTVNAIVQNGLVPVFVDIDIPTYNIDPSALEQALSERTAAVMVAHTLGNPFDVVSVREFAQRHDLWLIEDCCDALGARYRGEPAGSFGDLATFSFYPAHQITTGEGGAVVTRDPQLKSLVQSFRDWGRDCWCDPGRSNTCGRRFEWALGDLPRGYDHKYIYSHVGYNLKATDMQAAVGVAQLKRLPSFLETRRRNFERLFDGLRSVEEYFILPRATPGSEPSWFGFALSVRPGAPFSRNDVVRYLDEKKIDTRLLFGGNLLRQPAYREVKSRIAGSLRNTDFVAESLFWVGVYPGITCAMMDYMVDTLRQLPAQLERNAR